MKKVFCILAALVIAISSTLFCFAGDDSVTYGASYTAAKATPTVDGVFNASEGWGNPMVTINAQTLNKVVARYTSDNNTGAGPLNNQDEILLYLTWDDTNLYFATVRKGHTAEKHFSNGWKQNGIPAWQFCATQLMIISDWTNVTNGSAIYTQQPIDTFVASATTDYGDAALAMFASLFNATSKRLDPSEGYKVAIKNTDSVETCEIAIPWAKLSAANKVNPKNGAQFSLGVVIHNSDSSAIRVYGNSTTANGENGSFANKDYFLKVTLAENASTTPSVTTSSSGGQTTSPDTGRGLYIFAAAILSAAAVAVVLKRAKVSA